MGSESDLPVVQPATDILKEFGVPFEIRVLSAHRTPDAAAEYATSASQRGMKVMICAAGGAAHLAGVVAGHTTLPVIGIPVPSKFLNGLDSLLSTVQMPSGVPVATVAVGGAKNAALLAVQILAVSDAALAEELVDYKAAMVDRVRSMDMRVQNTVRQ
jgi:5-(carboxyamino)imidazole ribonucleotide mutase